MDSTVVVVVEVVVSTGVPSVQEQELESNVSPGAHWSPHWTGIDDPQIQNLMKLQSIQSLPWTFFKLYISSLDESGNFPQLGQPPRGVVGTVVEVVELVDVVVGSFVEVVELVDVVELVEVVEVEVLGFAVVSVGPTQEQDSESKQESSGQDIDIGGEIEQI